MKKTRRPAKRSRATLLSAGILSFAVFAASPHLPEFDALSLTGEQVSSAALVGQWTLLIVTPSRDAAESTRRWATALRDAVDTERYRVRDVLAIDPPFFISKEDAISKAKEAIPERYHDQTWLLTKPVLEQALNIPPDSESASVIVLNDDGAVVGRVHGAFDEQRLAEVVEALDAAR